MATSTDNVLVALTGSVLYAPTGTTLPTTAAASWNAAFLDVGYISEDGIEENFNDESKTIKAWQKGAVVRRMITGSEHTFKFKMIEQNLYGVDLFYKGSTVTGTTTATLPVKVPTTEKWAFGFDIVDGSYLMRIVVPTGEVTERGNVVYKNDEPIGREITLTAYPNSSDITAYIYTSSLSGLS